MSCLRRYDQAPSLLAVIASIDYDNKTINTLGSIGDFFLAQIKRNGNVITTISGPNNDPANGADLPFVIDLQNGDEVILRVFNNTSTFEPYDEDIVFIPTPDATNPYFLAFSFEDSQLSFPNSDSNNTVHATLNLVDFNGLTATININGTLAAFLEVNDNMPIEIDNELINYGSQLLNTAFGVVSLDCVSDVGFNYNDCVTASLSVKDQRGIASVQNAEGITCAIMVDDSIYLMNDQNEPITYYQIN